MSDPFSSPKSLIRRAKKQINDLRVQINAFTDEKPWTNVIERDADGVTDLHKVKFTKRLSDDLPHIIFECANNLRAVLDQIAWAVATNLALKVDPKSAKFPFGPTESDMRNNAKGGCKDLPPEIVALFVSFNPYNGGNHTLWALNELANTPKHKLLYPVGIGANSVTFTGVISGGQGGARLYPPPGGIEKKTRLYSSPWASGPKRSTISMCPSR